MSVLKIDTDRYVEAAAHAATAGRGLADAVLSANAVLVRTGGMAGWDSMGAEWAGAYDPAAREILEACQALALGSSDTARALTFSAGNYISAEHVASMGVAALVTPSQPDSVLEAMVPCVPSASESRPGVTPEGWDIVSGLAGIAWPAGDPSLLRDAAATWTTLGADLDAEIGGPTQQAVMSLDGLMSTDISLFRERSAHIREAGALIAQASRDVGASCESIATAIDAAHEELTHATKVFVAEFVALAAIGTIASFVTLGGAGAITSLIGAARVAQLVLRVHEVIAKLTLLARGALVVGSRLPGAGRLTSGLQALTRSPTALRSAAGAAGRTLEAGAPRTFAAISLLAPAVRVIRPISAVGLRVLDSRAVSVALSDPAAIIGQAAARQVRRRFAGATAVQGKMSDQALSAATRSASARTVVTAGGIAVTAKDRWDAASGLVALPGTLKERYAPTAPGELGSRAAGPGRLTAVRASPAHDPMAASTRDRRTSHPAASP